MKLKLLHRLIIHVALECRNTMPTEKRKEKLNWQMLHLTPNISLQVSHSQDNEKVNYEVP